MDAVRTAATLIKMISMPVDCQLMVHPFTENNRRQRKIWETRPGATSHYDDFPFTVKITTASHQMPKTLQYSQNLFNFVTENFEVGEPTAAAVVPPTYKKKPKTHGLVCFADRNTLRCFIQQWNGGTVDGEVLILHEIGATI